MKKFILERYAYAPELNRIHFANGATMAAVNNSVRGLIPTQRQNCTPQ